MHFLRILLLLLFLPLTLLAQKDYKLGEIDRSYFEMTHCPWDSSAGAFYILDYGVTRFDYNLEVELTVHVRLKILNSSEFHRANVTIPFYLKDGAPNIKAYTYNLDNGQVIKSELEKNGIFKEKVIDDQYELKFTLPNVKEGSILEYQYSVKQGSFYRLNTWYFQTSIPVEKSEYHVKIPNWLTYQRLMTPYVSLNVANISKENGSFAGQQVTIDHHHYEAWRVPAFKDEPFVPSIDDVISNIRFELRTIQVPGRATETIIPYSYAELNKKMLDSDYWTKDIDNAPWARKVLDTLLVDVLNEEAKARKIFDFIKEFNKADETSINLSKCLDVRAGTDYELNRLLIAMLNEVELKAEPVRISTRSNGQLHPLIPLESKFNHVIVKLTLGEKYFLLDASEKYSEFGVLPKYCINGRGLVVNSGEEWIDLTPIVNNGISTAAELVITEDGKLSGVLQIKRRGYEASEFDDLVEKEGKEKYLKSVSERMPNWEVMDHLIEKTSDVFSVDEKLQLDIEGKVEDLGNLIYISPVVYGQYLTNPFKNEERKFPVNFGVTQSDVYYCKIKIPAGYAVESLPKTLSIALPGNAGSLAFNVSQNGNELMIVQRYKINKIEFGADEYASLREFHALIVDKHAEQIVLRKI